ncbi:MAG TPA: FxLYD domain-containing protein [Methylomirabilota bacterium]|nr:FxLYD domain-containing protein [Methylomirabilota bacterium]
MTTVGRRLGCGLVTAALLALMAVSVAAQGPFRITYDVDRSSPGRTRIAGQVFNDTPTDVVDVYVTAEAVDGNGKVVARGISFVSPAISRGGSAPFEAAVPAPPSATNFRVRVSSYRQGLGASQAP